VAGAVPLLDGSENDAFRAMAMHCKDPTIWYYMTSEFRDKRHPISGDTLLQTAARYNNEVGFQMLTKTSPDKASKTTTSDTLLNKKQ
jgi:hypothetical protein